MPIDFYYVSYSPPCCSVMMAAKALNLELNPIVINTSNKDHLTPEFIKINPQHTFPTIVDDGFAVWESRAINTYLVNMYAKGSPLYPEEPKARAVVDQRLYFDVSVLYQRLLDYFPIVSSGKTDEVKLQKLEDALGFLETFLNGNQFVAGQTMTLADISIVVTISYLRILNIEMSKYPNVNAWYDRMKNTAPGFSIVEEGVATLKKVLEDSKKTAAS